MAKVFKNFLHFQPLLRVFLAKSLLPQGSGSNCGDKKLVLTVRRGDATIISDGLEPGAVSVGKEIGPLPRPTTSWD